MGKKYDIYFCYSRRDTDKANLINYALRGRGYNTFYDCDNNYAFIGGFQAEIHKVIDDSAIFLYLHTSNSLESAWCRKELEYAYKQNIDIIPIIINGNIPIVPEGDSVSFLNRLNCFNLVPSYFDTCIDVLISRWLPERLAKVANETVADQNVIVVQSDRTCRIYRLEEIGVAYKDISTQIQVPEGNHKLVFVDYEKESVRVEKNVSIYGDSQEVDIKLLEKFKKSTNSDEIDVFISYNSDDLDYAKEIAEMCKYAGKSYFLADESLKKSGNSAYKIAIDKALAKCRHLVVVVMTLESLKSAWVEYEYQTFHCEKLSGRKDGNLITITGDGITDKNLPIPLSSLQFIPYAQKEDAIEYFK